jgi:hypothetical protein
MMNAGEELTTEKPSDGQPMIQSRGLSVFVMDREITLEGEQWRNETGLFDSLEEAVKDCLRLEVEEHAPEDLKGVYDVSIQLETK